MRQHVVVWLAISLGLISALRMACGRDKSPLQNRLKKMRDFLGLFWGSICLSARHQTKTEVDFRASESSERNPYRSDKQHYNSTKCSG